MDLIDKVLLTNQVSPKLFVNEEDSMNFPKWKRITDRNFFNDPLDLSRGLIGKILIRKTQRGLTMVRISEVEAYLGLMDDACHSYGGRLTKRTEVFYKPGATIYVYLIYGLYWCFNIVAGEESNPSAVLIRSAEPVYNLDLLNTNRFGKDRKITGYMKKNLLNGPGKLSKALEIDKTLNGEDILKREDIYLLHDGKDYEYTKSKRMGIEYAKICRDKEWRFIKV